MRSLFVAMVFVLGAIAVASPIAQEDSNAPGQCSQDCWNESAQDAGCDPNTDDDCLCGDFFDADTSCVARCPAGEALQVINILTLACDSV
ncbi:hypothetical protein K458DRAFT_418079 [Lentithecium fluviatile CBS 122367]|uniref:CFEM domain-containing protein n=1 Tax=Lentithecium fluviatile CBS 122367 TaxID=1168545 RepID=A0A6G1J1V7_9PLEO|nr:hypothetical protein K458DRAFT_418079 [Lentithecium fluviatile CBS 122367]